MVTLQRSCLANRRNKGSSKCVKMFNGVHQKTTPRCDVGSSWVHRTFHFCHKIFLIACWRWRSSNPGSEMGLATVTQCEIELASHSVKLNWPQSHTEKLNWPWSHTEWNWTGQSYRVWNWTSQSHTEWNWTGQSHRVKLNWPVTQCEIGLATVTQCEMELATVTKSVNLNWSHYQQWRYGHTKSKSEWVTLPKMEAELHREWNWTCHFTKDGGRVTPRMKLKLSLYQRWRQSHREWNNLSLYQRWRQSHTESETEPVSLPKMEAVTQRVKLNLSLYQRRRQLPRV